MVNVIDRDKMFFVARFGQIHSAFPLSETLMEPFAAPIASRASHEG